jgi:hypothetical protein
MRSFNRVEDGCELMHQRVHLTQSAQSAREPGAGAHVITSLAGSFIYLPLSLVSRLL